MYNLRGRHIFGLSIFNLPQMIYQQYLAVIEPTADGLLLKELAPDITVTAVRQATEADLIIPDHVPEMPIL